MEIYKKAFNRILAREMTSASVFHPNSSTAGTHGGSIGNHDSYAPGDARIPYGIGSRKKTKAKKGKRGKKKRKKLPKVPGETFPIVHTRVSGMSGPSNNAGFGIF